MNWTLSLEDYDPSWYNVAMKAECTVEDCSNKPMQVRVKMCSNHYKKYKKYGDPTVKNRGNHGKTNTPTYSSYKAMKNRVLNPNSTDYKYYAGRGISICDRWLGVDGFSNFLEDMGERPTDKTIDRIDNNGDYEPTNCRWATRTEQMNNVRNNIIVHYNDRNYSLSALASKYNIAYLTLFNRLKQGWSVDEAIKRRVRGSSLSENALKDIKKRIKKGEPVKAIGLHYHVHYSQISLIKRSILPTDPKLV